MVQVQRWRRAGAHLSVPAGNYVVDQPFEWWVDAGAHNAFSFGIGGENVEVTDPEALRALRDALTDLLVTLQDRDYDRAIQAVQDKQKEEHS